MEQIRTMGEFIGVIKRRFFIMAAIVIMGSLGAVYYAINQPSLYETRAVLQIEGAQVVSTQIGQPAVSNGAAHKLTLIEQRLMARDSLVRTIEKLNLFGDMPQTPLNEKVDALRSSVEIRQIKDGAQAWQPNVTPSGMLITVTFGDPVMAAEIANEFLNSVLEENRKRNEERSEGAIAFFGAEEARVGREILEIEDQIAQFKSENARSLPEGLASQRDQLGTLRETQLELEREIIGAASNTSRQRESVVARQVERLEEQRALVDNRIAQIQATIAEAPEVERELGAMTRKMRQLQDQYSVITRGRAEAEMGQVLETRDQNERFIVLETALIPEYPVSPSRKKLAMLGFIGSSILATMVAFGLEMANPAIRTSAQLERQLGIEPVVAIPYVKTNWQQRRGILSWIGGVLTFILTAPFALRAIFGKGVSLSGLGNFFKREAPSR